MKKEFPFYKSVLIEGKRTAQASLIEKKIRPSDKKVISDFLLYCGINSKGEKRADNRKRIMVQLCDFLEKPLNQITNKDVLALTSAISKTNRTKNGKNDIKDVIKRFLKWYYKDWETRFDGLKIFKSESVQGSNKIKSTDDLITELEFNRLMKATSNLMHKTLICGLWETAGRPEELLKSRYSDVDFIKKNIKLHSAKTGKFRVIPTNLTIDHLKRLKEETNAGDNDLIFTSQKQGKQLSNTSFNFILKNLTKKAGIKKNITGYTFRHTRLSTLIKSLSPKTYEMISGHSLEMGMRTYAHLNVDDLTREMQEKIFGIKELTPHEKDRIRELEERIAQLEEGSTIVPLSKEQVSAYFQEWLKTHSKKDPLLAKIKKELATKKPVSNSSTHD